MAFELNGSNPIKVVFLTEYAVSDADACLVISGSIPELGSWNLAESLWVREVPKGSGKWISVLITTPHKQFSWKWVVISKDSSRAIRWENTQNREQTIDNESVILQAPWNEPALPQKSENTNCEWCFSGSSRFYCESACCDGRCCIFSPLQIASLAVGGLFFLGSLVCCGFFIYCMCKKKGHRGTPVMPYHNSNSVFVNNAPQSHPPPSYNQYGFYPSSSTARPPPYSNDPPGTVNSDHPPTAFKL